MRRDYLGDAIDFWKARLLAVVRETSDHPTPLKIVPMITDEGWSEDDFGTYARVLGVERPDLATTDRLDRRTRSSYFGKLDTGDADVFLDPDTGMTLGPSPKVAHVTTAEVERSATARNVVAVYQHMIREPASPRQLRGR